MQNSQQNAFCCTKHYSFHMNFQLSCANLWNRRQLKSEKDDLQFCDVPMLSLWEKVQCVCLRGVFFLCHCLHVSLKTLKSHFKGMKMFWSHWNVECWRRQFSGAPYFVTVTHFWRNEKKNRDSNCMLSVALALKFRKRTGHLSTHLIVDLGFLASFAWRITWRTVANAREMFASACRCSKGNVLVRECQKWDSEKEWPFKLTVLVHVGLEALAEAAGAALVAVRLVDGTAALGVALRLTGVHPVPVDGPFEEARATCKF